MELSEMAAGLAKTACATRCSAGRRLGIAPRTRIRTDRAGLCAPPSAAPRSSLTEPPLMRIDLSEPTREKPSPRAKGRPFLTLSGACVRNSRKKNDGQLGSSDLPAVRRQIGRAHV